jgi:hypothetical protein
MKFIYANNQIKISSWLHTDITYTDFRILEEIKEEKNKQERIKQLDDL